MIEEDHCVYVKKSGKELYNTLTMHGHDILLAGNDMEMILATKECSQLLR